jgi:hypothetical protein
MNKEFIPYEQALALKELGFDEPCFGWFRSTLIPSNFTEFFLETEFGMNESPSDWVNSNFLDKACSAPLYQQAFRWFREKYNLICRVSVTSYGCTLDEQEFYCVITSKYGTASYEIFNTYEEAELDCLDKLIEIVKQNKKINLHI